jgi:hypothetical protein
MLSTKTHAPDERLGVVVATYRANYELKAAFLAEALV